MRFYRDYLDYHLNEKRRLEDKSSVIVPDRGLILGVFAPAENQDKKSDVGGYSVTRKVDSLEVDYQGIFGDRHRGLHRLSTGRERAIYPKGTEIAQRRHILAISRDDCLRLSGRMGIEITPELLGANLLIGGNNNHLHTSAMPPNTYFLVASAGEIETVPKPPIATLIHYVAQEGCGVTGNAIAEYYGDNSLTKKFADVAKNDRGILLSIEYPVKSSTLLRAGQNIFFKFPTGISP